MQRFAASTVAALCLGLMSACSGAASVPADDVVVNRVDTASVAHQTPSSTGAPAPAPKPAGDQVASKVIGMKDRNLSDGKVCDIDFVYAGREPEDIFWEEPCAAVTAKMMVRGDLEQLGRWERLDAFERKFVEAMPGGKVLYVEGASSASIYPIGTGGTTYEVAVAD